MSAADPPRMRATGGTPRLVVLSGHPTEWEVAAIAAAVAEHRARSHAAGGPPPSRWLRAARLEACGHQPIDNPATLAASQRPRRTVIR